MGQKAMVPAKIAPWHLALLLLVAGCGGSVTLEGDGAQGDAAFPDPMEDDSTASDPQADEPDAPPPVTWARSFGGDDYNWAYGAGRTPDGGYVLAGEIPAGGENLLDITALSLDSQGRVRWQKAYGSEGDERHRGLAMAQDGGFVVTGARYAVEEEWYDILAVKIDASGTVVWQYAYGGAGYDWGHAIGATSDGGFVIAGVTTGGEVAQAMVVLKIDGQGRMVWQRRIPRDTYGWAIAVDEASDGGIIIGGEMYNDGANGTWAWVLKLDQAGGIAWQRIYGGDTWHEVWSVCGMPDGGTVLAGATEELAAGVFDFWILRLDGEGNVLWQKACGGPEDEHARGVDLAADGGLVVAGWRWSEAAGNDDMLLVKLDAHGNGVWQRTYGGAGEEWAWSVLQAPDGGFFLYGATGTYGAGELDIWGLKTDAAGRIGPDCPAGIGEDAGLTVSTTSVPSFDLHAEAVDAGFERREIRLAEWDTAFAAETQCGP